MSNSNDTRRAAEELGDTVADATRRGAERARSEYGKFKSRLRANGAHLEEELRDAGERFGDGAKRFGDAAAEQIREHPLAAFGIAFAAGIVLSRILRHR